MQINLWLVLTTKNIEFHIELNKVENLYADPELIYDAFGNIIENAIKYSKDEEDVEIHITSCYIDKYIRIIFKDKGKGISEKNQKKIFEKFERVSFPGNEQNKVSGFGLGLNFVYQIVKAHGGSICVNSKPGVYSEFIINIPQNANNETIIN